MNARIPGTGSVVQRTVTRQGKPSASPQGRVYGVSEGPHYLRSEAWSVAGRQPPEQP